MTPKNFPNVFDGDAVIPRPSGLTASDATVEYYLAVLLAERLDYNKAWHHLHLAEKLVSERNHDPRALHELRQSLAEASPE